MKKHVICSVMGGLGNQLFQYAAARTVADQMRTDLILDVTWYQRTHIGSDPRRLLVTGLPNVRIDDLCRSRVPVGLRQRVFKHLGGQVLVETNDLAKQRNLAGSSKALWLHGYWQDQTLFIRNQVAIRRDFATRKLHTGPLDSGVIYLSRSSLGVHIRRGDYVANQTVSEVHQVADLEYFLKAIKYVKSRRNIDEIFYFSDDPTWVEENLVTSIGGRMSGTGDELTDFVLLSKCKHHIISNSTFSWWAAWLGETEDQLVVAPRRWFHDESRNKACVNALPNEWVVL